MCCTLHLASVRTEQTEESNVPVCVALEQVLRCFKFELCPFDRLCLNEMRLTGLRGSYECTASGPCSLVFSLERTGPDHLNNFVVQFFRRYALCCNRNIVLINTTPSIFRVSLRMVTATQSSEVCPEHGLLLLPTSIGPKASTEDDQSSTEIPDMGGTIFF